MQSLNISCSTFVKKLENSADHIWSRVITFYHSTEKHTESEWLAIVDSWKSNKPKLNSSIVKEAVDKAVANSVK